MEILKWDIGTETQELLFASARFYNNNNVFVLN